MENYLVSPKVVKRTSLDLPNWKTDAEQSYNSLAYSFSILNGVISVNLHLQTQISFEI